MRSTFLPRSATARLSTILLCCASATLSVAGCARFAQHRYEAARAAEASRSVVVSGPATVPETVRDELQGIVREGVQGVTAIAMRDGKLLYRVDVGAVGPDTQYPVASASKWMAAALVLTVVDEGGLALDESIENVLPGFRGAAGRITVRQLLAQTAGMGSLKSMVDARQDPRITLAQSAAEIARRPLEDPPGRVFKYGGPGFQVAGALVEAVTGERWAELFEERIAAPLGMTRTYWTHLPGRTVPTSEVRNPLVQGGVVTTAEDYMRFLTMVAQRGSFAGHRILSAEAVDAMETAQTLGIPKAYLPPGANPGLQYALGNWCERWSEDGRCSLVSSPGAFGTYPWIDRRSGIYGIFFLRGRFSRVAERLLRARDAIIATATREESRPSNARENEGNRLPGR